jgi:putative Ca2+/H+ antiporter (TMEM165/GDT1 family)
MEWKIILTAFTTVFLAELGDKTQLATLFLGAGSASRWSVFIGSSAALVLSSALACLVADAAVRVLPVRLIRLAAGVLFIALGLWMILVKRAA